MKEADTPAEIPGLLGLGIGVVLYLVSRLISGSDPMKAYDADTDTQYEGERGEDRGDLLGRHADAGIANGDAYVFARVHALDLVRC